MHLKFSCICQAAANLNRGLEETVTWCLPVSFNLMFTFAVNAEITFFMVEWISPICFYYVHSS